MVKVVPKVSILDEALEAVHSDRRVKYGSPADNFTRVRDLCRATGRPGLASITAEDIVTLMILMKVARDTNMSLRDNAVDIAGYADVLDCVRGL